MCTEGECKEHKQLLQSVWLDHYRDCRLFWAQCRALGSHDLVLVSAPLVGIIISILQMRNPWTLMLEEDCPGARNSQMTELGFKPRPACKCGLYFLPYVLVYVCAFCFL